jgi:hypothetical protein
MMIRIAFTLAAMSLLVIMGAAACTSTSNNNLTSNRADTSKFRKVISAAGKELLVLDKENTTVTNVLKSLTQGKGKDFKIERSQLSAEQLTVLDGFTAESTGVAECKILSVEGCNSCCADNISSSIRHTTCGDFCDKVCGAEPCH